MGGVRGRKGEDAPSCQPPTSEIRYFPLDAVPEISLFTLSCLGWEGRLDHNLLRGLPASKYSYLCQELLDPVRWMKVYPESELEFENNRDASPPPASAPPAKNFFCSLHLSLLHP